MNGTRNVKLWLHLRTLIQTAQLMANFDRQFEWFRGQYRYRLAHCGKCNWDQRCTQEEVSSDCWRPLVHEIEHTVRLSLHPRIIVVVRLKNNISPSFWAAHGYKTTRTPPRSHHRPFFFSTTNFLHPLRKIGTVCPFECAALASQGWCDGSHGGGWEGKRLPTTTFPQELLGDHDPRAFLLRKNPWFD
jgi:hypothetical protein